MLYFANKSAIWPEHNGSSSFLLQAPCTGAAWRLGVIQWLGRNNLELSSLSGSWCWLWPRTPAGYSARVLARWLSVWFFTFFPAWCLSSKSKCLQRVSLGCIHIYESAWKVTEHHFCCSYRLHGPLRFLNIITWGECVGRDMSSRSIFWKYNLP